MLPLCSAAPASSPISFHVGARAFSPLPKIAAERRIIQDRPFYCFQGGTHAQDVKTHAAQIMHSLVVESPEDSCSLDSSIFSPYPNDFDNIAHGFSNDYFDTDPSSLGDSVRNIYGMYTIDEGRNISDTEVPHGDFGNEVANEVSSYGNMSEPMTSSSIDLTSASSSSGELLNLPGTLDQSTNALSERISTSLSPSNVMTNTIAERTVTVPDASEVTNKGLSNLKENIEHFLSGINESAGLTLDRAENGVKSKYNEFTSTASDTLKSVQASFDSVITGLFPVSDRTKEQASDNVSSLSSKLQENIFGGGILAVDFLRLAIVTLEDSLANAATFVVYSYGSAKSFLPLNVRDTLNFSEGKVTEILRPVGAAFQQIYIIVEGLEKAVGLDPNDPLVPFVLILGSSATIGASLWLFIYGGYSGDLDPEMTLELLKNDEKSVLIDVRPEDSRKRNGIPDLRRGTRSKYASVSLPEIDGSTRKMLKGGGKEIDEALTAVVIRNLKLVQGVSKVIVMDESGGRSKTIARFLKKFGVKKPYLVQGGFQSWVKKGLRIKELKPETTLSVLNEEAEAILEDIKPTPALVIGYSLGISAAIYALLEWERTLQVIGIIGLVQTLYRRVASYKDSEDFKQDVRLLLSPVKVGAQAFSWAARKLESNKVGLPTSPSSSAVQNRVLQAVAKHESQPSDSEKVASEELSEA